MCVCVCCVGVCVCVCVFVCGGEVSQTDVYLFLSVTVLCYTQRGLSCVIHKEVFMQKEAAHEKWISKSAIASVMNNSRWPSIRARTLVHTSRGFRQPLCLFTRPRFLTNSCYYFRTRAVAPSFHMMAKHVIRH